MTRRSRNGHFASEAVAGQAVAGGVHLIDRWTVMAVALVLAAWWFASSPTQPVQPERPFLKWVSRAAKNLLWLALLAEKPPEQAGGDDSHEVQVVDGFPLVDHTRGL